MYELFTLVSPISRVFACVSVSVCWCVRERERECLCGYLFVCVFVRYYSTPCVCVRVLTDKSWYLRFEGSVKTSSSQKSHIHTHIHVHVCKWSFVTVCLRDITTKRDREKDQKFRYTWRERERESESGTYCKIDFFLRSLLIFFHLRPSRINFTLPRRPSSALRHRDVVKYTEVADFVHSRTYQTKRRLTWTVNATPMMTLATDLGLSIRVFMLEYVTLVTGTSS